MVTKAPKVKKGMSSGLSKVIFLKNKGDKKMTIKQSKINIQIGLFVGLVI